MNNKKGFTLIELLVVISIIAVLMAIMMPALGRAKKQAASAVCSGSLKQWGTVWMMYAQDYNGKFFRGMTSPDVDTLQDWWFSKVWGYAKTQEMRFCPVAKKYDPKSLKYYGGTYQAWGPFEFSEHGDRTGQMAFSSYGINLWVLNPTPLTLNPYGYDRNNFWRTINVGSTNSIPLIMDSAFSGAYSTNVSDSRNGGTYNKPMQKEWESNADNDLKVLKNTINAFAINRHSGAINVTFLDFSVRKVALRDLWSQKWHRSYDTNESQSWQWPDWMSKK
jgi:prepilin-type N-terminal cleavage/methylation domain-containing protein/prepilin-type processing-associated H-X9-DG protein